MRKLFTKGDSNPKIAKSDKAGRNFLTQILHLAPAKESGYEVCSSRSVGCTLGCLYNQGRGRMNNTQKARIARTVAWMEDRAVFKSQVIKEIAAFVRKCDKLNTMAAIRMNGTSDILWEVQFEELFSKFPQVQFYDYTKHVKRCLTDYALPTNYHLTFSKSEDNDKDCLRVLDAGLWSVAVVFRDSNFPTEYWDRPVYSADEDDLRFFDPPSQVGGLVAKGTARKDDTGFVVNTETAIVELSTPNLPVLA